MITRHLVIKGKVQGVFFRASAKELAEALGIKGWVKNTEDGDVEIVCQGTEDQLAEFINWCKQGPSRAKVENVHIQEMPNEHFNEFRLIRNR
jgi:acylphosphatase